MACGGKLPQRGVIQKLLECPLCLHQVEEPWLLSCFHIICGLCLDELPQSEEELPLGHFKCPVCLTSGITKEVEDESFLSELLGMLNSKNINETFCKQCPCEPKAATLICEDCKLELCEQCGSIHRNIPFLLHHQLNIIQKGCVMIIDKMIMCGIHYLPYEMNCQDCNSLMCKSCIFSNHYGHRVESLSAKEESMVNLLTKRVDTLSKFCKALQTKVRYIRKRIDETELQYDNFMVNLDMLTGRRVDLQKLQNQCKEMQTKEVKSLQDVKQRMECQLSKAEQLQMYSNAVLNHSKSMSRVIEIKNGILSVVEEYIKTLEGDHLCVRISLPRPFLVWGNLHELQTYPFTVGFSPFGHLSQIVAKSLSFRSVFSDRHLTKTDAKQNLQTQFRLSQIGDTLWLPQNQNIEIYLKTGELSRTIEFDQKVTVVKQACNGHLMFGGHHGLLYRPEEGAEGVTMTHGLVSDISCHGFLTAVSKVDEGAVELYELQDKFSCDMSMAESQWVLKTRFKVNISRGHIADTLLLTEGYIYYSTIRNKKLLKYSLDGDFIDSVNLHVACLISSTDVYNNILLSRYSTNGGFRVCDGNLQIIEDDVLINQITYPLDIVIDDDFNIWVLRECMESPAKPKPCSIVKLTETNV